MKYLVKTSLLTFFCMVLTSFCPYDENSRLTWFIVLLLVLFGTGISAGSFHIGFLPWGNGQHLRRKVKANGQCAKYRQCLFRDIKLAAFHSFRLKTGYSR